MKNEITITASGPVGCGKSALLGEIEIMFKAMGVPVRYADEAAARAEKNGTHAEWTSYIEMYEPSVVLVEQIVRASPAVQAVPEGLREALMAVDAQLVAIINKADGSVYSKLKAARNDLVRVWLPLASPSPAVPPEPLYTCTGKGGEYKRISMAIGAGTSRGAEIVIYEGDDGVWYFRTADDFAERMAPLAQPTDTTAGE